MRRQSGLALALVMALAPEPIAAQGLASSPRPLPRPGMAAAEPGAMPAPPAKPAPPKATPGAVALPSSTATALPEVAPPPAAASGTEAGPVSLPRPRPRPEGLVIAAPAPETAPEAAPSTAADPRLAAIRPLPRPKGLETAPPSALPPAPVPAPSAAAETAKPPPGGVLGRLFSAPRKKPAAKPEMQAPAATARQQSTMRGAVCGVPGLIGQRVARIGTGGRGCGVAEPVRITSVSGIKLSQPMTVDCETATAFKKWVDRGIVPAVGGKGGGVARLEVGPGYVCRGRNGVRGAKMSEHGRGKAIDLMGLVLHNGQSLDVLRGWTSQPRILRKMHASACGIFGTVLGPKSDSYHRDHIHVDTARYRSGTYCR